MAANKNDFRTVGTISKKIEVGLSYRIVELFSEGLYASANKAFEELVTNAFDAGARSVQVLLPPDPTASGATIVVIDDGTGMNALGLEELWQIGQSNKRTLTSPPRGRTQIGKFGIGKLATYVLASELTYVCKNGNKFYATTMDYGRLGVGDSKGGLTPSKRVKLDLRELTRQQAEDAVAEWTASQSVIDWPVKLFGRGASPSWSFAILSSLKDKANEIEPGRLKWILSTALPLRDDFSVEVDGVSLEPSKLNKARIGRWTIGKELKDLPKPAPDKVQVRADKTLTSADEHYYGLYHPKFGRVTGYAEAYKDTLTGGKSGELGRSHGFFVYARGRLINVDDEYFGIDSNVLRHGTFARVRIVAHADHLDEHIQSAREGVRHGPTLKATQNLLQSIFNFVRPKITSSDDGEAPGKKLSRSVAGTPATLARRPIVSLVKSVFQNGTATRHLLLPSGLDATAQQNLLEVLSKRAEDGEDFVSEVHVDHSLSTADPLALYAPKDGVLHINALHPFVSSFADDFLNKRRRQPLETMAMAEVLLEAQLHALDVPSKYITPILSGRDELLRYLASQSGRRSALSVAQALQDARNDKNELEEELVEAFRILGFSAERLSGSGRADGVAEAPLSAGPNGERRAYKVSLEAKSKETDGKTVSAKSVGISTVTRQREALGADHALVCGPAFPASVGKRSGKKAPKADGKSELSALEEEIAADRKNTGKTVTLIRIDDLAELVRIAPMAGLAPSRLRDLFTSCSMPGEAGAWVEAARLEGETQEKDPFREVLDAIWEEQKDDPDTAVKYSALRVALKKHEPPVRRTDEELKRICRAIEAMAPPYLVAREDSVEMEVEPDRILDEIEAAMKQYPKARRRR